MANSSWINKIIYRKGQAGSEVDESFPIGTTFDKVYDNASHKFSLRDLANTLKTFFNSQVFMLYSANKPTNYSKTMEWYALTGDTSQNEVDSKLVVNDPNQS